MKPQLDDIITRMGRGEFERACEIAWRTAAGTGRMDREDEPLPDGVYRLEAQIWDEPREPAERVALLVAIYGRMPCYALMSPVSWRCAELPVESQAALRAKCRDFLGGDDYRLADPIGYWLWCGPFENCREECDPWWRAMADGDGPPRLLERLLAHSGPVPWELKAELYQRLLPQKRWHPHIHRSLMNSMGDIYGDYDQEKAEVVLDALRLPPDFEA